MNKKFLFLVRFMLLGISFGSFVLAVPASSMHHDDSDFEDAFDDNESETTISDKKNAEEDDKKPIKPKTLTEHFCTPLTEEKVSNRIVKDEDETEKREQEIQGKYKAYNYFMNNLRWPLKNIESGVKDSVVFSPEFREKCMIYTLGSSLIEAVDGKISDSEPYVNSFFSKSIDSVRKNIVDVVKQVLKLEKELNAFLLKARIRHLQTDAVIADVTIPVISLDIEPLSTYERRRNEEKGLLKSAILKDKFSKIKKQDKLLDNPEQVRIEKEIIRVFALVKELAGKLSTIFVKKEFKEQLDKERKKIERMQAENRYKGYTPSWRSRGGRDYSSGSSSRPRYGSGSYGGSGGYGGYGGYDGYGGSGSSGYGGYGGGKTSSPGSTDKPTADDKSDLTAKSDPATPENKEASSSKEHRESYNEFTNAKNAIIAIFKKNGDTNSLAADIPTIAGHTEKMESALLKLNKKKVDEIKKTLFQELYSSNVERVLRTLSYVLDDTKGEESFKTVVSHIKSIDPNSRLKQAAMAVRAEVEAVLRNDSVIKSGIDAEAAVRGAIDKKNMTKQNTLIQEANKKINKAAALFPGGFAGLKPLALSGNKSDQDADEDDTKTKKGLEDKSDDAKPKEDDTKSEKPVVTNQNEILFDNFVDNLFKPIAICSRTVKDSLGNLQEIFAKKQMIEADRQELTDKQTEGTITSEETTRLDGIPATLKKNAELKTKWLATIKAAVEDFGKFGTTGNDGGARVQLDQVGKNLIVLSAENSRLVSATEAPASKKALAKNISDTEFAMKQLEALNKLCDANSADAPITKIFKEIKKIWDGFPSSKNKKQEFFEKIFEEIVFILSLCSPFNHVTDPQSVTYTALIKDFWSQVKDEELLRKITHKIKDENVYVRAVVNCYRMKASIKKLQLEIEQRPVAVPPLDDAAKKVLKAIQEQAIQCIREVQYQAQSVLKELEFLVACDGPKSSDIDVIKNFEGNVVSTALNEVRVAQDLATVNTALDTFNIAIDPTTTLMSTITSLATIVIGIAHEMVEGIPEITIMNHDNSSTDTDNSKKFIEFLGLDVE